MWGLPALLSFLAGTAGQLQQPQLWPQKYYVLGFTLAIAIVFITIALDKTCLSKEKSLKQKIIGWGTLTVRSAAMALLAFSLTGWRAEVRISQQLAPALIQQEVLLTGRIADLPQQLGTDTRFVFAIDSASLQGQTVAAPPLVLLSWYGSSPFAPPQADAVARPAMIPPLHAGQRWQFLARMKPIHGSLNPFGFDYELWAFERGLGASGSVRLATLLQDAPQGWAQLLPQNWNSSVAGMREATRKAIAQNIPAGREASVLTALVMGEQSAIERNDWDLFRATGVAHLMSISGLHITLFAWLAIALIRWLWCRSTRLICWLPAPYAAWLGGLCLACFYSYYTGWGIPAQRTCLMLFLATSLRLTGRQWPWLFSLLMVACTVLLLDPWALLQAGFWLSFIAVGVLILHDQNRSPEHIPPPSTPPHFWQRHWQTGRRFITEQGIISLALAPLSLLLFQQFSLVGVLANLVAIPVVTFLITPLALAGLAFHPLWQLAAWALQALLAFLQWCAAWPYAVVHTAGLPWLLGAAAVASVLLALLLQQQAAPLRWRALGYGLCLLTSGTALLYHPPGPAAGEFSALFLDIGQGNAILVRTQHHTLLYDTGPRYNTSTNAGERIVLPLLRALAVQPEVLVISHQDSDHSGGAAPILQNLPPQQFYTSMSTQADWPAQPAPTRCQAGLSWDWDGVHFVFLRPKASDYQQPLSTNAMSCVLRISNGASRLLLAGDIPAAQEKELIAALPAKNTNTAAPITVLLAPHHGSKTSSSPELLQALTPLWVVVQSGYLNRYGHPAPSVLQRYAEAQAHTIGNVECGAITWASDAPQHMGCLRRDHPRYWWQQIPDNPTVNPIDSQVKSGH